MYRDPAFGPGAAAQGGMVVAAVGAAPYRLSPPEANQLAEELRLALQDKLPALPLVPPGEVAMAMGQAGYERMLLTLSDTGRASPGEVADMARRFSGQRFAVFARMEQDRIERHRDRNEDPVYRYDKNGKRTDKLLHYAITDTYAVSREVAAQVTVIELGSGRVMWSGRTRDSARNENRLQGVRQPGWGGVSIGDIIVNSPGAKADEFPEPPDRAEVLAGAFREAAEAMFQPQK